MTNIPKFLITFVAIATLAFVACNKDNAGIASIPEVTTATQATSREELKMSKEEREDIAKTIKEIEGYKEKFDAWRKGKNTQNKINPQMASEQIEMIWNYNVSRPGTIFRKYEFVTAVAVIGDSEIKEWTGADAAYAYEAVKVQIVKIYNGVEGINKGINMIDMSTPSFQNGKLIMYIQMNVGIEKIEDGVVPETNSQFAFFRWAADPMGFTQVGCGNASNQEIAVSVNQTLGFFLKNLPPYANGLNPKVSSVNILGPVEHVQTNYFGTTFPLGTIVAPVLIKTLPLFVVKTTTLKNSGASSPYLSQGEFKIHADVSFGANNFPDENCFNTTKFATYCLTNKEVGDSYTPRVNQILGGTVFTNRRLISTFVGSSMLSTDNPITPQAPDVYLQEHPTYHFYARTVTKIEPCCIELELVPIEDM